MKNILTSLFSLLVGIGVGIAAYGSYQAHTPNYHMETPEPVIEYIYIEKEPEVITETIYVPYSDPLSRTLTDRECDLLEQISMAEAKGEGVLGMMLVMNVVLNRAEKDGKTIEEVIFAEGQFYTEGMTPYVSEECHAALNLVIQGYDFSEGAIYFNKYGYRDGCEPVLQYKNHYFSK